MLKLRSMRVARTNGATATRDAERLTRLGRFLRRTSIDEIPQLLNVVAGEMSLVGPRPLLPRYSPFYTQRERTRFRVRPGITGLAQISGRNTIGWDKKLALDADFVDNYSVGLYLTILIKTPMALFSPVPETAWELELPLDEERRSS
jgi:lipopolysaccharide/colanic/teichoic acid biosynthesis glycosyltransferase